MKQFIKSFLILGLFIQLVTTMETKEDKPTPTLGEYMRKQQAKRRLAWQKIETMKVKSRIQRAPAVEEHATVLAVEDYSNYRRPAVMPNY